MIEDLKGKKVLILGMGKRTTPPLTKTLNGLGAEIVISDKKKEEDLQEEIEALSGMRYELYLEDRIMDLDKINLIIPNPAVPPYHPLLFQAKERGIPFFTELELAYRLCKAPIIGITGTNGKTTTTTLLGDLLKRGKKRVEVGGNIGRALIGLVEELTPEDLVVAEVSSFQLSTIINFRPYIGVILNLAPDHLDYHGTWDEYMKAKKRLFMNQGPLDYALFNQDVTLLSSLEKDILSQRLYFSTRERVSQGGYLSKDMIVTRFKGEEEEILSLKDLPLWGRQNLANILAAVVVARLCQIEPSSIQKTLLSFQGLEHRLEKVAQFQGVTYYNSSKATNPMATLWDLEPFHPPLILIMGGQKRGSDFQPLFAPIIQKASKVLLLGETADELEEGFKKRGFHKVRKVRDLEEGVRLAAFLAEKGSNILLSPAAPSWDMFTNYEERGLEFKRVVSLIQKEDPDGR